MYRDGYGESRWMRVLRVLGASFRLGNFFRVDLRKDGNTLDLGIALGLLAAYELVPQEVLEGRRFCGELGLDGSIRPIRGALAIADLARRRGMPTPKPSAPAELALRKEVALESFARAQAAHEGDLVTEAKGIVKEIITRC